MSIAAGTRLGPYEILTPIGAGGMGEVYRAKDTRLDRDVAIKVLSEHLSANPELRQRFEREARAISALTHPHICTLHDVGNQDGVEYLVMELLDGESLSDRLTKGPLPPDQVIKVGIEIADALEAAHRQGIVHRDLKPGNVMLTKAGVKLLDFGLAKHRAATVQSEISQLSSLPTEMSPSQPLTEQGTIMGTFQYMAPEQLEGKDADARSDIFAFGCVLFEMATGRKAFSGKSRASLIGAILKDQPAPISSIQPMTPPALDRLVQTCLAKEPDDRFQTAHDVKLQLQWIAEGGSQAGAPAIVVARRRSRERTAWAVAAAATAAAIALGIGFVLRKPAPKRLTRFEIAQPAGLAAMGAPKVSPDGRQIAFAGTDPQGKVEIWVRSLDALEARPLAGTEGATTLVRPFWSPDSRQIAYFVGTNKLMKIPVDGGPPQKICDSPTVGDGTWSEDGTILFDGASGDPIRRVAADGGIPKVEVAGNSKGLTGVGWPQFLPGGKRFLFINDGGKEADNGVWIAELGGGALHRVVSGLSRVELAPPDELLFVRENTLVAQRVDPSSGKLRGEPVPVAEGVGIYNAGQADFSASRNGVLVYRAGQAEENSLVWLDLSNGHVDAGTDLGSGRNPALSPDGRWLAVDRAEGKSQNIWLRDLKRGVSSRFTTDPKPEYAPLFTPDGKRILFSRDEGAGKWAIISKALDSPEEKVLVPAALTELAIAISPDGRSLLYVAQKEIAGTPFELRVTDLGTGGTGKIYAPSTFSEFGGSFSPDGRWLAFQSNESGRYEIYVQSFPEPGRKWQISTDGGLWAVWAANGHDLYYISRDGKLMRVDVKTSPEFDAGVPQALFTITLAPGRARSKYLLAPDGKRFLVMGSARAGAATPMTVVLDWNAAVRR